MSVVPVLRHNLTAFLDLARLLRNGLETTTRFAGRRLFAGRFGSDLQALNQLEFLRLNSTQVTDAGLAHLSTLGNLQRLDLWGNPLSDQGMNQIWNLPSLRHLEYGATSISHEWTAKFQEAHPHVFINAPGYPSKLPQINP